MVSIALIDYPEMWPAAQKQTWAPQERQNPVHEIDVACIGVLQNLYTFLPDLVDNRAALNHPNTCYEEAN